MRRRSIQAVGWGLWALCSLGACGYDAPPPELSAEAYRVRGDAAFTAADQMMETVRAGGTADGGMLHAEAVDAYVEAANDLIRAFRMEDPVPERTEQRALLAFRIGRALSSASRRGITHPHRGTLGRRAVLWFGEAVALQPSLAYAHFERAVMFESDVHAVRDLDRARQAYTRFLEETAGRDPDPTLTRLRTRAGERVSALRDGAAPGPAPAVPRDG